MPEEVDRYVPFADYGLDSILAVDLVEAINQTLAIDLRTISVFDHSSVERLAAHVLTHYCDAIAAGLGQAPLPPEQGSDEGSKSPEKAPHPHSLPGGRALRPCADAVAPRAKTPSADTVAAEGKDAVPHNTLDGPLLVWNL